MSGTPAVDVGAGADLTDVLREMTIRVPGVWTLDQLRASLLTCHVELEAGRLAERLIFALSCLVAGGEAERLGFDSYRIYPHRLT